jgi:hypothetical protein
MQSHPLQALKSHWSHLARHPDTPALPHARQLLEMTLLFLLRGIGPGYYLQGRWWRPAIPFADKWAHANRREYRAILARLNPPPYRKSSQHKLVEKAVLRQRGLRTAEFVGFVQDGRGFCRDGEPLRDADGLEKLLQQEQGRRICFKKAEGWGGSGFAAYDVGLDEGGVWLCHPISGERLRSGEWWQRHGSDADGYLLERYLRQHPALAAFNPNSVNTLRLWVLERRGEVRVVGGYLRVGSSGSQVDNISSGGFLLPLDVDSGCTLGGVQGARYGEPLAQHPATGQPLAGVELPLWPQVLAFSCDVLRAFPNIRLLGLDIAITPEGPAVIEANVEPDSIGCAWMDLPFKRLAESL